MKQIKNRRKIEMVKSDIIQIHQTIKSMLGYAMALSESPIPEIYELGHYLADNILTKICLVVAIDKGEELEVYTSKGWTKPFPDLYKDHLKSHYAQVPDYNPDIKEFHEDRNIYQHRIESFDRTMRQPRAKAYVELVEEIMKTVGIIKSGEIIRPSSLSPLGGYNFAKQQIKTKEMKYQQLHDLLKMKNDEDIHIKIEHAIKEIFYELQKILNMKGGISRGMRYLHNSKWDANISSFGVSVHSKELGKGYGLNEPNQDDRVVESFLQYYRECCENVGMNIKP